MKTDFLNRPELLQDRILLYDNIANFKHYKGRLLAQLEVFPFPQIKWDLEILGDEIAQKGHLNVVGPIDTISGYKFKIEEPFLNGGGHNYVVPLDYIEGVASKAIFGDVHSIGHVFGFFLPNTRFQSINLIGQKRIDETIRMGNDEYVTTHKGRFVDARLDNIWNVMIETSTEAIEWLDRMKSNIGTRITAKGTLYSAKEKDVPLVDYPVMSLAEAESYLNILSIMLSFLNGGYIGPVLLESIYHFSPTTDPISEPNALIIAPKISPLEQTGISWCAIDTDLPLFLSCFPCVKRMLENPPWDETFGLILSWYFQAIQPEGSLFHKRWQIIANALGTALERLSYTILVLEEDNPSKRADVEVLFSNDKRKIKNIWGLQDISPTGKRLQLLLERIGVSIQRGYWDVNEVKDFIEVRNEATHPKKGNIKREKIFYLLGLATQWIYETLLWRIGYNGTYLSQGPISQPISCRYDITTRNPNW